MRRKSAARRAPSDLRGEMAPVGDVI